MSQCHWDLRGLGGKCVWWRRATGERETCWRKRGVSLVSGMICGIRSVPKECPARGSYKSDPQECALSFSLSASSVLCTLTSPHAHIRRCTSLPPHTHTSVHPHCHSFTSVLPFFLSFFLHIFSPSPLHIYIFARSHPQIYLSTSIHLHIYIAPAHPHCHSFTSALSFSLSIYLFDSAGKSHVSL